MHLRIRTSLHIAGLAATVMLGRGAAHAALGDELMELLPNNAAAGDRYGESAAISGTTAIVGSHESDALAGTALLFDTTTGEQIAELHPFDGWADDWFAFSVAIDGSTAIAGSPKSDGGLLHAGSAYLFDATTGEQIRKLIAADGSPWDWFGVSVAISGTTAIVGAYLDDHEAGDNAGSAYLFDTTTGAQIAKLVPDDAAESDFFGYSVAIEGNIAVVGARLDDDDGYESGSAYLFDATTGEQLAKLLPEDGEARHYFGHSVAISGNTVVVGAPAGQFGPDGPGSAYVFDATTGEQIAKLLSDDGETRDRFGDAVAISGDTAVVGAPKAYGFTQNPGSAYLFDTTSGAQTAKLFPADHGGDIGYAVGISDATAIVGAPGDDDIGLNAGSCYLFDAAANPPCAGDSNGDGLVNVDDLVAVLTDWGTDGSASGGDLDGNGDVDVQDLVMVFIAWGDCEL